MFAGYPITQSNTLAPVLADTQLIDDLESYRSYLNRALAKMPKRHRKDIVKAVEEVTNKKVISISASQQLSNLLHKAKEIASNDGSDDEIPEEEDDSEIDSDDSFNQLFNTARVSRQSSEQKSQKSNSSNIGKDLFRKPDRQLITNMV